MTDSFREQQTALISNESATTEPFVSVIMPVYNRCEMTQRAVHSLLGQTDPDWELVCIDDCSTDGVSDVLKDYADSDSRIIYQCNMKNSGPAVSRNAALDRARGQFVAILDNDDFLPLDFVANVRSRSRTGNADILIFEYDQVDVEGKFLRKPKSATMDGKACLFGMYSNPSIARVYRRSALEKHHIRYPVGKLCEDAMWVLSTNCLLTRVEAFEQIAYHNTVHGGSLSRNDTLYASLGMDLLPLQEFSSLITYVRSQNVCSDWDTFAYFCMTFGFLGCFLYSRGVPLKQLRAVSRFFQDTLNEMAAQKNAYTSLCAWKNPMVKRNIRLLQHIGVMLFRMMLRLHIVYPFAALSNVFYRITHRKS